ncbi:DEAD/DEAH box helicase [Nonomuraea soli]|uniref:Superfamily I DNA and RNA helicase n=1 Tax=Nonomuraea soli TaxID=1032476 RepID=A0A7W0CJS4_9ACTN|nr:ATP-binding domain-containing protein [Nonomuraea soli]MBA2892379.1 superfamily I DNA and RNA helicase [Nonomuraea soli]
MALEIIYGESRNRLQAKALAEYLSEALSEGTIYLGYPVLATTDDRVYVDALLLSEGHGLVAFQIAADVPNSAPEWETYTTAQDRLYGILESHLGRHPELRRGRHLAFSIETVTVFPSAAGPPPGNPDGKYTDISSVGEVVSRLPGVSNGVMRALQAALQRISTIKPAKKRASVKTETSRGAILKIIEKEIANLDRWQKKAAIETPDGPQRIRGLAGSGKTIVLALKAAYLQAQHPDWNIAVTFQSRALYQQIVNLVTRFSFEHSNDAPDFEKLQILHAWGSSSRYGVYMKIAEAMNQPPRDFNYARATYGMEDAFRGICRELLSIASQTSDPPIFDAILIDEAQDLPPEFFQLVYRFTTDPKRIVWAYDELQKLSEAAMPSTSELFGTTPSGAEVVNIDNRDGEARRDIVLEVCYRNSPWALAAAHALGFGIYRQEGLVQHFDEPQLWSDIGYSVQNGRLEFGSQVALQRSSQSYPKYFLDLLTSDDAVMLQTFDDELQQDTWLAQQILRNLQEDELEHDDILIVLPSAYTSKQRGARLARTLIRVGIRSHLVGVNSSVDEVFIRDSIAIAHIYRAKGNEASMVYALDSQYAVADPKQAVTRRNTLFTAITRSKAWVRICGFGPQMQAVANEVAEVRERSFVLDFKIPTQEDLARIRRIHRDRSRAEAASIKKFSDTLQKLADAIERNEIDVEDIPLDVRARLISRLSEDAPDDEL